MAYHIKPDSKVLFMRYDQQRKKTVIYIGTLIKYYLPNPNIDAWYAKIKRGSDIYSIRSGSDFFKDTPATRARWIARGYEII